MHALLARVDAVLRGGSPARCAPGDAPAWRQHVALLLLGGALYGGVMGSFGGVGAGRGWQVVFSAAKVPALLIATCALSLPSFIVLNTLLGLRADLPAALRALASAQSALALILASLAPVTALWYASCASHPAAILFNAAMFAIATLGAQGLVRRAYRPLVARSRRHAWLLRFWFGLYAFVGIQMGWVLRPFVGDPGAPTQFLRADSWSNAYVVVARLFWELIPGLLPPNH